MHDIVQMLHRCLKRPHDKGCNCHEMYLSESALKAKADADVDRIGDDVGVERATRWKLCSV